MPKSYVRRDVSADHGHSHVHGAEDARRLAAALGLIVAFMAAEIVAGILAHSRALLRDRFSLEHTTLQVEHAPAKLVQIR